MPIRRQLQHHHPQQRRAGQIEGTYGLRGHFALQGGVPLRLGQRRQIDDRDGEGHVLGDDLNRLAGALGVAGPQRIVAFDHRKTCRFQRRDIERPFEQQMVVDQIRAGTGLQTLEHPDLLLCGRQRQRLADDGTRGRNAVGLVLRGALAEIAQQQFALLRCQFGHAVGQ